MFQNSDTREKKIGPFFRTIQIFTKSLSGNFNFLKGFDKHKYWEQFYEVFMGFLFYHRVKFQIWPHLLGTRAKFLPNFGKFWNFQMRPNFNFEVCFMRFLGVLVQILESNLKFGHQKAIFLPNFFEFLQKFWNFFLSKYSLHKSG